MVENVKASCHDSAPVGAASLETLFRMIAAQQPAPSKTKEQRNA